MTRLIMVLTLAVLLTGALVPSPTSAKSLDSSLGAGPKQSSSFDLGGLASRLSVQPTTRRAPAASPGGCDPRDQWITPCISLNDELIAADFYFNWNCPPCDVRSVRLQIVTSNHGRSRTSTYRINRFHGAGHYGPIYKDWSGTGYAYAVLTLINARGRVTGHMFSPVQTYPCPC
jgi:hypothetical protein